MLNPARLGLLTVQRNSGNFATGTGYAITDSLILTAHHVVFGKEDDIPKSIEIRFLDGEPVEYSVDTEAVWSSGVGDDDLDVCLLRLSEHRLEGKGPRWGYCDRYYSPEWNATGFPVASKIEEMPVSADVQGRITRYGGKTLDLYELECTTSPKEGEHWSGLSGAPVFSENFLVGVIRSTPPLFTGERLYATPVQRLFRQEGFRRAVGDVELLCVPTSPLSSQIAPPLKHTNPANLLLARNRVVPFFLPSRQQEWQALSEWCDSTEEFGIRLFTGSGGAGKTRLLIEWCAYLRREGWLAGFLSKELNDAQWSRLLQGTLPTLVVVDYAETRPQLAEELKRLYEERNLPKLCVVLLARETAEWWTGLQERSIELLGYLREHEPFPLQPIMVEGEIREQLYEQAYSAFAYHRGLPFQERPVPTLDLTEPRYERILYLHMAALAALEQWDVPTDQLLEGTVLREQEFWCKACLPNDHSNGVREFKKQTCRLVGALTLRGGSTSRAELKQLNDRVSGPGDEFFPVLEDLYPGREAEDGNTRYLSGLEPDLLGEALVIRVLMASHTPSDYLDHVFVEATQAEWLAGFTVLGRVSLYRKEAEEWLKRMLQEKLTEKALSAFQVALSLGSKTAFAPLGQLLAEALQKDGELAMARQLEPFLPIYTVSLREIALWVTEKLASYYLNDATSNQETRASYLNNLGNRYSDLGRMKDALETMKEAVRLRRELAEEKPRVFQPKLAQSLNNLGAIYSGLGRSEDALSVTEEARNLFRKLREQDSDAFLPELAMSLGNLGSQYSELGQRKEGLEATQKAVDLFRKLVEQKPNIFLPNLALSLNNLSSQYGLLGEREKALSATKEAVTIYQKLTEQSPDAFLPYLATALHNLGIQYNSLKQREDALKSIEEAVRLRRKLVEQRPDTFLPSLAISLIGLGMIYGELGHREDALKATEEYREDALKATEEAVALYRKLVEQSLDAFLPDLAQSLSNLGADYSSLERREEAQQITKEAVNLFRRLAKQRPDAFLPDLAKTLHNLSLCYGSLGQRKDALSPAQEAVALLLPLVQHLPQAFQDDFLVSLRNLARRIQEAGQREEDVSVFQEAQQVATELGWEL